MNQRGPPTDRALHQAQTRLEEVGRAMEALGAAGPAEDDGREALQKLDPLWDELFPAEKERIVKLLVEEVVVSRDGLLIRLRLNGLNSLVAELQGDAPTEGADARLEPGKDGQTANIRVPMDLRRRSGRKEIILPPDAATTPDVGPRRPIVVALARAYKWQRMLDTGEVGSMDELAERYGVDRGYITRIAALSTLAPDIIQAVIDGREPDALSLRCLRRRIPTGWDQQRTLLGMTG